MRMCEGCTAGEHWRCGMQTWCECDCDGSSDFDLFEDENEAIDRSFKPEEEYET